MLCTKVTSVRAAAHCRARNGVCARRSTPCLSVRIASGGCARVHACDCPARSFSLWRAQANPQPTSARKIAQMLESMRTNAKFLAHITADEGFAAVLAQ